VHDPLPTCSNGFRSAGLWARVMLGRWDAKPGCDLGSSALTTRVLLGKHGIYLGKMGLTWGHMGLN